MSPLRLGKAEADGKKIRKKKKRERRSGAERRTGEERRSGRERRKRARHIRDLYRSDLDRHLWSWASGKSSRRKRRDAEQAAARRKKAAGVAASVAGALGAVAGISWLLLKKARGVARPLDPEAFQADLDEADFEE